MKGIFKKAALAAALVLGVAGSSYAAVTTVGVTATVSNVCAITTTGAPVIAFGTLDPSVGGGVGPTAISAGTVAYNCTKGSTPATYTVAGAGTMTNGTDTIAYSITPSPAVGTPSVGAGFGAGTAVSVTINGSIAAGAYANASVGAYSDTITVTVAP